MAPRSWVEGPGSRRARGQNYDSSSTAVSGDESGTCGYDFDLADSFHRAVMDMLRVHDNKKADYAVDGSQFSNFNGAGRMVNLSGSRCADLLEAVKLERLRALAQNNRNPANESILDTYRDKMCYAAIAYAMALEDADR